MDRPMRQALQALFCIVCLSSCYSAHSSNPEYQGTFVLNAMNPEIYAVEIKLDARLVRVPPKGHFEIFIPETKEGRSFVFGMPVSGPKIQNRKSIWIRKSGRVYKKLSLAQLWRLPKDASGHHVIELP